MGRRRIARPGRGTVVVAARRATNGGVGRQPLHRTKLKAAGQPRADPAVHLAGRRGLTEAPRDGHELGFG
jgi:hypothetical protein